MRWNRAEESPTGSVRGGIAGRGTWTAFAAVAAVCAAMGGAWLIFGGRDAEERAASDGGRAAPLREATPSVPPRNAPSPSVADAAAARGGDERKTDEGQPPPPPPNDVGKIVTNAFGKVFKIEAVVVPRGPRMNGIEVYRDRRLFASNAENALDGIVNQEPGDRFLGDFDEAAFEREFLAAMGNRIEVTAEDNEDEARRKLQMIDMKRELMAAHENGESIGAIVKGMRDSIDRSADLRDNLIADLVTIKNSGASPDEVEDFYAAANRILGENGIKPIYSPATIRQKLKEAKMRMSEKRR